MVVLGLLTLLLNFKNVRQFTRCYIAENGNMTTIVLATSLVLVVIICALVAVCLYVIRR